MYVDDGGGQALPRYGSTGGQSQSSGGIPTWAIGAGVGGAVVVLLLVFFMLRGSSSPSQGTSSSQQVSQSTVPPRPNIGNSTRPRQPSFNTSNSSSRPSSRNNPTQPPSDGFSKAGDSEYPGAFGNEDDSSMKKPGSSIDPLTKLRNQLRGVTEPASKPNSDQSVSAPVGWNATADPPLEELMYDTSGKVKGMKVNLGSGISDQVLLPKSFSPYMAFQLGNSFVVYDMRTGRRKSKSRIQFDFFAKPALSPQGGFFATTTGTFGRGGVAVYDVAERENLGTISIEDVEEIMFPSDERLLVITKSLVRMIELPSGKTEYEVSIEDIGYFDKTKFTLSPGGRYLSIFRLKSEFRDSIPQVETFDLKTQQKLPTLTGPEFDLFVAEPAGVSFSQDGKHLAAGVAAQKQGRIFVWNFETGELEKDITLEEEYDRLKKATWANNDDDQRGLAWFPDKQRLLFKEHGVVDLEVGELVYLIPPAQHRNSFRWPVSESQVVGIAGDLRGASMITVDLPVELFDKAREVIAQGGLAIDAVLPPITTANTETGLPLQLPTGAWSVTPDPAPIPEEPIIRKTLEFKLPSRDGYFSQFFLSDAKSGKALIARKTQENKFRFYGEPIVFKAWVDVYDLDKGRKQASLEIPYPADAVAFSPSGNLVATRDAERQYRLDLWNPEEEAHHLAFRPFQDVAPEGELYGGKIRTDYGEYVIGSHQIAAVRFLDDEHLLTLSGHKRLRAWKLPECELIYEIEKIGVPGISPGSQILAIHDSDHVMIFESRTGKPLGLLNAPGKMRAAGFDAAGKSLAVSVVRGADYFLYVWDLESGNQTASFPLPRPTDNLKFADQNNVLLNNRYLVNLESEAVAWNYRFPEESILPFSIDDRILYFGPLDAREPTIYLAAVNLPDESITNRIAAASLSSDSIPLSGKSVSVISNIRGVSGDSEKRINDKTLEHYQEVLQQQGAIPKPNGRFQLVLSTEEKGGRTVTYRVQSDPFSGSPLGPSLFQPQQDTTESANVKNVTCSLTIEEDGLPVWQSSSTFSNFSFFVRSPKGSSIQSTLDSQLSDNIGKYFLDRPIPTFVFPPGAEAGLGESRLNEEGILNE
jgi:hypothetical protein